MQDLAIQRVKLLGLRIHLHPQAAGGFVDKVDGLVGQKTVGDVAVRQRRRGHQGGVGDFHPVVKLILFLDSAEDGDCVLHRRLIDHDRLEAAGKGRVLLHILAVFIQRRRAYAVQLAPRQGRLDEVRRIHRAVGLARADEGVHLVDEQDDLARGGLDFLEDRLQPLLELAAIFRAGDECAHVERHELLVLQTFRYVTVDDAQRKPFRDRGLADARIADQHRVVLGPPRQHLHGAPYLVVAPDDRVDLAFLGSLGQVARIFLERVIAFLGRGRIGRPALAQVVDRGIEILRGDCTGRQRVLRLGVHHGQRHQHPFDRHEAVARLLGDLLGLIQNPHERGIDIDLAVAARHLGHLRDHLVDRFLHALWLTARAGDQVGRQALVVIHESLQKMFGNNPLMFLAHRDGLSGLKEPARPFRELFHVHRSFSFASPRASGRPHLRHDTSRVLHLNWQRGGAFSSRGKAGIHGNEMETGIRPNDA